MKIDWIKVLLKISTWLFLELALGFLGLDNLADYSEYLFTRDSSLTTLTFD